MFRITYAGMHPKRVEYGGLFGGEPGVYSMPQPFVETVECEPADAEAKVNAIKSGGCKILSIEEI